MKTIIGNRQLVLGKSAARHDPRNLKMAAYMPSTLPLAQSACCWYGTLPESALGMDMNDQIGICVIAAEDHTEKVWTANSGKIYTSADADLVKVYSDVTGYITNDVATDRGTNLLDALKYWKSTGIAGHKIDAWIQVNPQNTTEIALAIQIFGSIFAGVELPLSAQLQMAGNGTLAQTWDVCDSDSVFGSNVAGSWGGHGIQISRFDHGWFSSGLKSLWCSTWGKYQEMTLNFLQTYTDNELFAPVSVDWLMATGVTPSGFNLTQLLADAQAIAESGVN